MPGNIMTQTTFGLCVRSEWFIGESLDKNCADENVVPFFCEMLCDMQ